MAENTTTIAQLEINEMMLRLKRQREQAADAEVTEAVKAVRLRVDIDSLGKEVLAMRETIDSMTRALADKDATILDLKSRLDATPVDEFSAAPTADVNAALAAAVERLRAENASLLEENSRLDAEVERLNGEVAKIVGLANFQNQYIHMLRRNLGMEPKPGVDVSELMAMDSAAANAAATLAAADSASVPVAVEAVEGVLGQAVPVAVEACAGTVEPTQASVELVATQGTTVSAEPAPVVEEPAVEEPAVLDPDTATLDTVAGALADTLDAHLEVDDYPVVGTIGSADAVQEEPATVMAAALAPAEFIAPPTPDRPATVNSFEDTAADLDDVVVTPLRKK